MSVPGQPQSQLPFELPALEPQPPPVHRQRLAGPRAWLRSRTGRVVVPVIALLLGTGLSLLALFFYNLSFVPNEPVVVPPLPSSGGDIAVQVSSAYITRILPKYLPNLQLPMVDDVEQVQIMFSGDDQLIVTGYGHTHWFGISGLKVPIQLVAQPLAPQGCRIRVQVMSIYAGKLSLFWLITPEVDDQIAQQLQVIANGLITGLPSGFTYCITDVRTKPGWLVVMLSATPKETPSVIPTATPTAAPTATPKVISTATPKTTPTATPKVIPTATPTATPRAVPTATPKVTPTAIPKATPKVTPKPSP